MTLPFQTYPSPLVLFSGSAGTGSGFPMGSTFDQALLVQISGSATTISVTMYASANGVLTSSAYPMAGTPIVSSSDTRVNPATATGLYYYPYVGGTTVFAQVSSSGAGNPGLLITGTPLKK